MCLDQVEAEDPAVVEVNGPGGDRARRGLRLALARLGHDDQFREPGLSIDVKVESCPGLTAPPANGPDDGGGVEEGAVDGEDLAVKVIQRTGGLPPSRSRLEDFTPEVIEDRLQPGRVGQLVEVGKGALAEFADGQMLLSLPGLTEILDGPQGPQRGIEEGQKRGDEDVVQKEVAIAVGFLFAELFDEPLNGANVLGPDDLLGPDGQIAQTRHLRPDALGMLRGWNRSRRSFLGRHNKRLWPKVSKSASEDLMKKNPRHYCEYDPWRPSRICRWVVSTHHPGIHHETSMIRPGSVTRIFRRHHRVGQWFRRSSGAACLIAVTNYR